MWSLPSRKSKCDQILSFYICFLTCTICFVLYVIFFTSCFIFLTGKDDSHDGVIIHFQWWPVKQTPSSNDRADGKRFEVVHTLDGPIRGRRFDKLMKVPFYSFKGIPYASPPVKDLRFQRPIPHAPWKKVKDALRYGPNCIQYFPDFMKDMMHPNQTKMSEDCLFLNIWTPSLDQHKSLPVMFWIHGGAFQFGSGSHEETDGSVMASTGEVVVVSLNYRLNVFGFINLEQDGINGNMGLYDQAMALHWVRENIHLFGGNPDEITLWGESAGAISVAVHLISPVTKTWFKRGIMQSGSLFLQEVVYSQNEALAQRFTSLVGCHPKGSNKRDLEMEKVDQDESNEESEEEETHKESSFNRTWIENFNVTLERERESLGLSSPFSSPSLSNSSSSSSLSETLKSPHSSNSSYSTLVDCLQGKDVKTILTAVKVINDVTPMSFIPSAGEFFMDESSPKEIRTDLPQFLTSHKDLLMGFNSDEGSLILNSMDRKGFPIHRTRMHRNNHSMRNGIDNRLKRDSSSPLMKSLTPESGQNLILNLFSSRFHVPRAIIQTALPSYIPSSAHLSSISIVKGIYDFIGHNVFVCPVVAMAEEVIKVYEGESGDKNETENSSTFLYEMNAKIASLRKNLPDWVGNGSIHYEEVPLVFGYPFRKPHHFEPEEVTLSGQLMHSWINFAKNGFLRTRPNWGFHSTGQDPFGADGEISLKRVIEIGENRGGDWELQMYFYVQMRKEVKRSIHKHKKEYEI